MDSQSASEDVSIHNDFGPGKGADLVIQSSDNIQFYVRRLGLGFAAGAFPGATDTEITFGLGDVVHLTETADVLEILLEFAYPRRHPTLEDLPFEKLLRVADAAEKYEFNSAAPVCQILLRQHISKQPLEVFRQAVKYDYPDDFIDEVAVELCLLRINSTSDPRLHGSVAPAWTIYYQAWTDIFKNACWRLPCDEISLYFSIAYSDEFGHEWEEDVDITTSTIHPCDRCYFSLVAWISQIVDSVGSLASIKEELSKSPSVQDCMTVLNSCPCPPPFNAQLREQGCAFDKAGQNSVVVEYITGKCLRHINNMQSFAALLRECRSS